MRAHGQILTGDAVALLPTCPRPAAIITDPPYGFTNCEWDHAVVGWVDFALSLMKPGSPLIAFSSGKYTARLLAENERDFRHKLVWRKIGQATGHLDAKRRPMRAHEDILVFSRNAPPHYFPQLTKGTPRRMIRRNCRTRIYGKETTRQMIYDSDHRYPSDVLSFTKTAAIVRSHPSEKPVDLLRWLICSYTQPGDLVIDCFAGSGSTGVACQLENRRFIGIEKDPTFARQARQRLLQPVEMARAA